MRKRTNQHSRQEPRKSSKPLKDDFIDKEDENFDQHEFQQVQDPQYHKLLKQSAGKKVKTNNYFESNPKYRGAAEQDFQEENEEQELEGQQQSEQRQMLHQDHIKNAFVQIGKKKKTKSRLMDQKIRELQREDEELIEEIKNNQVDQSAGKSLRSQLSLFKKLVQFRYYSQSGLQEIKKLPISTNNLPSSEPLHTVQKQTEKQILGNIKSLLDITSLILRKSNIRKGKEQQQTSSTSQEVQQLLNQQDNLKVNQLNANALFHRFEEESKSIKTALEKELIKWSQKTTLANLSTSSSHYSSLIMQTPIGQANKVVQNFDRAAHKCQKKRGTFKILFEPEENIRMPDCKQIFDDQQLFVELQKEYEQELNNNNDDPELLVSDTLKYLKERQNQKKIEKDVDRKASKNRKLRFNVHPKLLNFMSSQNGNYLEAREEIVRNIFNSGRRQTEQVDYIDM